VGTRNHCLHGKNAESIQTIVDWRPFEYFTFSSQDAGKDKPDMLLTHQLEPVNGGTRVTVTMKLLMSMPEIAKRMLAKVMLKQFRVHESYDRLVSMVGSQAAVRAAA
jgi:hypothetical protein